MKLKGIYVALFWLLPLTAAAAQTPDYILERAIAARGGLEKIRAVQGERISGHISFSPEAEGPFVVELKRPRKMHMEFTLQGSTMVRVYDGKSAGWANNPFVGKNSPEPMSEEELKNISEESDFDGPPGGLQSQEKSDRAGGQGQSGRQRSLPAEAHHQERRRALLSFRQRNFLSAEVGRQTQI
ncbi:MAG: outer membrane lipoprotein carrier protein LolA [Candidatus Acidiferrales bacterium]